MKIKLEYERVKMIKGKPELVPLKKPRIVEFEGSQKTFDDLVKKYKIMEENK